MAQYMLGTADRDSGVVEAKQFVKIDRQGLIASKYVLAIWQESSDLDKLIVHGNVHPQDVIIEKNALSKIGLARDGEDIFILNDPDVVINELLIEIKISGVPRSFGHRVDVQIVAAYRV